MRYPDVVPRLTDGRVTLRAHTRSDIDGVYEQCQDPASQRWTTVPVPYTRKDAAEFLDRIEEAWNTDAAWFFAIEAEGGAGSDRFGGTVELKPAGPGLAEIGFGTHPGVRGKGVMTRAVELLLDWGFEATPIRTVTWWANAGNRGSLRVAWKNGFSVDGFSREVLPQRGALLDGWYATLRASDSREPKTAWHSAPVIDGERVRLRPERAADSARMLESTTDEQTRKWLAEYGAPHTIEAVHGRHVNAPLQEARGTGQWTVADVVDDRYVGTLNLFGVGGIDYASCEFGYWSHPDARGQGLLREALRLGLGHAFASADEGGLGLERVRAHVSEGNSASVRLVTSVGFVQCGRERRTSKLGDGSVVDTLMFEILKDELPSDHVVPL